MVALEYPEVSQYPRTSGPHEHGEKSPSAGTQSSRLALPQARATARAEDSSLSLDEIERLHIERVLHASGGNKTQAAKILRIDYKTLMAKLEKYELSRAVERSAFREEQRASGMSNSRSLNRKSEVYSLGQGADHYALALH